MLQKSSWILDVSKDFFHVLHPKLFVCIRNSGIEYILIFQNKVTLLINVLGLCFFSTLISGASRAITLSAIQVTHVVFTMQSSYVAARCT